MELEFFDLLLIAYKYIALYGFYILLIFSTFMTIQLIAYRVFHKNPYKWLAHKLELN